MLSVKDLMKELQLSRSTIVRMIQQGDIEAIKIGRQYRIEELELARLKGNDRKGK